MASPASVMTGHVSFPISPALAELLTKGAQVTQPALQPTRARQPISAVETDTMAVEPPQGIEPSMLNSPVLHRSMNTPRNIHEQALHSIHRKEGKPAIAPGTASRLKASLHLDSPDLGLTAPITPHAPHLDPLNLEIVRLYNVERLRWADLVLRLRTLAPTTTWTPEMAYKRYITTTYALKKTSRGKDQNDEREARGRQMNQRANQAVAEKMLEWEPGADVALVEAVREGRERFWQKVAERVREKVGMARGAVTGDMCRARFGGL